MALYEIKRACGHTEEIQIYGTNTRGQHQWRADREAEKPCANCLAEQRRKQSSEAAQVAATSGLPALTGSDKQIAWAETIRLAGLASLEDYARRHTGHISDATTRARVTDTLLRILTRIASAHADARWWIDNRHNIGLYAWGEATDADRRAIQAAEAEPQQLDEAATEDNTPDTPQAAITTLRNSGWTIAKIAAECGVHRSTVYRWQSGQRTPNARNTALLAMLTRS
ncbi:helix-turn-helix domain-containing protein [Dactylosporangium roseum]|uniref:Helix-turn-helix domain-containing protein n=1 Tax=Dactylosporangium roseum TaxID=47989 RepID=A0ABY5Z7K8_9ACTN|nr:helix-turn-helix domain-containing protein [Dactylosporangium roseum]UWZ37462.1 helix-turn-helix domain-containing protein [Dactylosporangium roseum]